MGKIRETAQCHTVAFSLVKRDNAPDCRYHTLYLLNDHQAPLPFEPLLDYFHFTGRSKGLAWQKEVAYSLGLFIDYIAANDKLSKSKPIAIQPSTPAVVVLFSNFARALTQGTIGMDGIDPLGLYWEPKTVLRASKLISNVTLFSDWAAEKLGTTPVNPWRNATYAERMAHMRLIDHRKPHQLLGYLTTPKTKSEWSSQSRTVSADRRSPMSLPKEPKIFPAGRMMDLLLKGFALPKAIDSNPIHERISLHNAMIAVLMHGGGLRESEPFHLYVSDVGIDPHNPRSATVRLYHPTDGMAPLDFVDPITGKRIAANRATYLAQKFKLEPRNEVAGRFTAGWKDLLLTDPKEKYAQVHWFPSIWGEVFLSLFKAYIFHCRKRANSHPYLFVSAKTGYAGDPYTIDSFRQAHAIACQRIGLESSKDAGTTPHGHRHAYGHALSGAGLNEMIIQRAMHHKSIHSQRVYTAPTASEMFQALSAAESNLSKPESLSPSYPQEALQLLNAFSHNLALK